MLFEFIKYIQPIWYFNQKPNGSVPYWLDYKKLPKKYSDIVEIGSGYKNESSALADAAYQLYYNGLIWRNSDAELQLQEVIKDVEDNYLFVSRFFSKHWLLYILVVRLLALKNPVREFRGFLSALKSNRLSFKWFGKLYADFDLFHSVLVEKKPLVSIIIPTLNRYSYLDNVLNDLEKQDYDNFEVIICDQSTPVNKEFYEKRKLNLILIEQEEKALWLARNRSIIAAKGEYVALSDDDMRISPDWISMHLKCIDYFNVDISAGTFVPENVDVTKNKASFHWASHFSTNNVLLKKEVFQKVGLFDRQFEKLRMGDGEFGMRCYMNGLTSISNPAAISIDMKAPVGGLRQMGSWDSIRPTKLFAPRPVPSVLYYARRYHGKKAAWFYLLKNFPKMLLPYKYRNKKHLLPLALIIGILLFPLLLFQIIISWNKSSDMIKIGHKIEFFE